MAQPVKGITLAETVLCLAIVGLVAAVLATVMIGGLRLMAQSRDVVVASEVAREVLERIKQRGFDRVPSGTSFDGRNEKRATYDFPPKPYPCYRQNGGEYYVVVRTTPVAVNAKRIVVRVFYQGRSQPVTVETLIHS